MSEMDAEQQDKTRLQQAGGKGVEQDPLPSLFFASCSANSPLALSSLWFSSSANCLATFHRLVLFMSRK